MKSLYLLIAEVLGQEKVTPMALAKTVVSNKKNSVFKDVSVKLLLNESTCSYEKAMEYGKELTQTYCHESISKSPCCGYLGTLVSDQSVFNLTLLTLKYAIPNFIYSHQPVADYLGLPYDHLGFSPRIGMSHMVLMCELPHGKLAPCTIPPEGFDTLWTPNGYCLTFNEMAPNEIYQVRNNSHNFCQIYKIQFKKTFRLLPNHC